jgi:hypothetical protein
MHRSRADPDKPSHEVELLVEPMLLLPLAELPLRVLSPLRAVPVLLPSPERVASPAADPLADPDALPLADPVAAPLVVPAVEPLVVSAASDAAEKARDTAAAMASIWCLTIIRTPFRK